MWKLAKNVFIFLDANMIKSRSWGVTPLFVLITEETPVFDYYLYSMLV
jgi:hypothetical protein